MSIIVIAALAALMFQSPSLRGSGRFEAINDLRLLAREVLIPFIAGQWSLRPRAEGRRTARRKS